MGVKRRGCMFLKKGGYQEGRDEKRKGVLIHLSALWAWTVCTFKGGLGTKEVGSVFDGGKVVIPQCTL